MELKASVPKLVRVLSAVSKNPFNGIESALSMRPQAETLISPGNPFNGIERPISLARTQHIYGDANPFNGIESARPATEGVWSN